MPSGMFVLCPTCDRDALEIIRAPLPLTDCFAENFRAIPPTKIEAGASVVSGCCKAELLGGPEGRRKFLAMRNAYAFAK